MKILIRNGTKCEILTLIGVGVGDFEVEIELFGKLALLGNHLLELAH